MKTEDEIRKRLYKLTEEIKDSVLWSQPHWNSTQGEIMALKWVLDENVS
jgi:hypothetical protein